MTSLAQRAERLKFARLLGIEPGALVELEALDAATIRALREQATAALFDADRKQLQKLAGVSRLLPVPVLVVIVKKALGPLLCARVAGLMPPVRAVEIAERLPTDFLVEVCLALDPRSAREVVKRFPIARIVEIALELARRGEYVTMGRFVDSLTLAAIEAVMKAVKDDAALLSIAFFVEEPARLDEIVARLDPERLRRILRQAADSAPDIWGEALALMSQVSAALVQKFAAITGDFDAPILEKIMRSTEAIGAWETLLPVVATMKESQQQRLLPLLNTLAPARLRELAQSVERMRAKLSAG